MAARRWRAPGKAHGVALVAVLWTIALLAILAAAFLQTMRTEVRMAHNLLAAAQARLLAEAGITLAVLELHRPDPSRRPRTDGSVYHPAIEPAGADGRLRFSVLDEAARIDLNKAPPELLAGLLAALEVEPALRTSLTDSILDWRDADDLRRLRGAENADYLAAGTGHGAKNGPFDAVEELLLLPGMTHELFRRLAPCVTVHSGQRGIDPALAPPPVVRALPGLSAEQAADYLAVRAALRERGQPAVPPDAVDRRYLGAARGLVYTIRSRATGARGGTAVIEATLRLRRGQAAEPFATLRWQEIGETPPTPCTAAAEDS